MQSGLTRLVLSLGRALWWISRLGKSCAGQIWGRKLLARIVFQPRLHASRPPFPQCAGKIRVRSLLPAAGTTRSLAGRTPAARTGAPGSLGWRARSSPVYARSAPAVRSEARHPAGTTRPDPGRSAANRSFPGRSERFPPAGEHVLGVRPAAGCTAQFSLALGLSLYLAPQCGD